MIQTTYLDDKMENQDTNVPKAGSSKEDEPCAAGPSQEPEGASGGTEQVTTSLTALPSNC